MMISQDYFDEVYLENVETFDLSPADALKETCLQLQSQQSRQLSQQSQTHQQQQQQLLQFQHLTLTAPDSEQGMQIRTQRQEFLEALQSLRNETECTTKSTIAAVAAAVAPVTAANDALRLIQKRLLLSSSSSSSQADNDNDDEDDATMMMYRYLLISEESAGGISSLLQYWAAADSEKSNNDNDIDDNNTTTTATTTLSILFQILLKGVLGVEPIIFFSTNKNKENKTDVSTNKKNKHNSKGPTPNKVIFWQAFQTAMPQAMHVWMQTYHVYLKRLEASNRMNDTKQSLHAIDNDSSSNNNNNSNNDNNVVVVSILCMSLQLAYWTCRYCEINKEQWMKLQTNDSSTLASLLVETLEIAATLASNTKQQQQQQQYSRQLMAAASRCVTVLCTYDQIAAGSYSPSVTAAAASTGGSGSGGMTVQSSHANVQMLAKQGAIQALFQCIMTEQDNDDGGGGEQEENEFSVSSSASPFVFAALRSMAILDETVQTMATLGVLQVAGATLQRVVDNTNPSNDNNGASDNNNNMKNLDDNATAADLATAIVGLFRNVCANDDIKSMLCCGKKQHSIVAALQSAMSTFLSTALLQEHACGVVAAMALRKPDHAHYLVRDVGIHVNILEAMQQHPQRVPLQRQGALAIRNLVSRSSRSSASSSNDSSTNNGNTIKSLVLDAGAERILREVSAQHVGCQDEVYAALRDLGFSVNMLHVEPDDTTGALKVSRGRQMFGKRNPNFRAVYD